MPALVMPALVRGLKGWRNLVGIGLTMPHKERIALVCDEVLGLGKLMQTVNAIRREPDGRLIGANTDGSGFLTGLRRAGYDPAGKRVLLAGVGGAGTAIAFSLAEAGVRALVLANRTVAKAEEVAARFRVCSAPQLTRARSVASVRRCRPRCAERDRGPLRMP